MVRLGEGQHQLRVVPQKSKLIRFFEHLHRGGTYAHLWTDAGSRSHWFRVDTPAQCRERQVPKSWLNHNVYFTVHPLSQIPPQNASGNHDRRFISSQLAYIAAVNALFAEYDGKDFVMPPEYQPYLPPEFTISSGVAQRTLIKSAQEAAFYAEPIKFKMRAWAVIDELAVPPSVIVDSGGGYHCVPLNTEILTQNGWKNWQQVQPGETVLGYDRHRGVMAWTVMRAKIVKEANKLVRVGNNIFSAVCTPDHRWVCHIKEGHQRARTTYNQLVATENISRRRHKIVLSAPFTNTLEPLSITLREAAILGWIATEGSITSQVRISQSERKYADEIRSLLQGIPHTERYSHGTTDIITWSINIRWFRELWQRAGLIGGKHEADWCKFVLHLSDQARNDFLDAAFKGDGTYNYNGKGIVQNPGNIADALKLAIFLSGYTPLVGRAKNRNPEFTRYGKPFATWNLSVRELGEGSVWCPQTDLGTWVMRQDDTICITGNCYWLLDEPLSIDESNRADIQAVQHAWVQMVNADPGAADLRRLLRMPGTYNVKAGFADLAPRVVFVKTDFGRLYDYRLLEEMVNDWLFAQRPPRATTAARRRLVARPDDEQRANFNRQHSLVDLLTQHGYQISFQTPALTRLARPGRDKQHSSVTVFAARADGTPELSIHFSSNDPLYSSEYRDPATGQLRRHAYDAFGVQQRLATLSINV